MRRWWLDLVCTSETETGPGTINDPRVGLEILHSKGMAWGSHLPLLAKLTSRAGNQISAPTKCMYRCCGDYRGFPRPTVEPEGSFRVSAVSTKFPLFPMI
jgi:hypothetical protein